MPKELVQNPTFITFLIMQLITMANGKMVYLMGKENLFMTMDRCIKAVLNKDMPIASRPFIFITTDLFIEDRLNRIKQMAMDNSR